MINGQPPFDPWRSFAVACDVALATRAAPEELEHMRALRLRGLLAWAAERSPLYGRLLKGRHVGDLQLHDLPVLGKPELMAHFDEWVTDPRVRLAEVQRFVADPSHIADPLLDRYVVWESSGSSGVRGVFVQDAAAMAVYDALGAVRHPWPRPLDRMFDPWYASERITFVGATGGHFAATVSAERLRRLNPALSNCIHAMSFLQPLRTLASQLEAIAPTILSTYPSAALLLAEEHAAGRLHIAPREIWTGGETLTAPMRGFVEREFGCRVIDNYGSSEFLTLAAECAHGHLHLNSDWAILEAVDRHGRPVPEGSVGERALLTNLANHVQPIIRYDLGDRILIQAGRCPCGSHLPVIHVQGRSDDMLRLKAARSAAVNVLPLALCTVLEDEAGLYDFQLEQTASSRLELRTALRGPSAEDALQRGSQALSHLLRRLGAGSIAISTRSGLANRHGPGGKVPRVMGWSGNKTLKEKR